MSGLELCQKLRENPDTKDIPIIVVTDEPMMKEDAAQWGNDNIDFVNKPINPVAIRNRVRARLKNLVQLDSAPL